MIKLIEAEKIEEGNVIVGLSKRMAKVIYISKNLSVSNNEAIEIELKYVDNGEKKKLKLGYGNLVKRMSII